MRTVLTSFLALVSMLAHAAVPPLSEAAVRAHMAFLADDLLEGRGTGQRGGDLAVRYLETQLQTLGLQPAGPGGFRQAVDLVGVLADPSASSLTLAGPGGSLAPALGTDLVLAPSGGLASVAVDAPVIFVGHGIQAADGTRDDYKGLDVRGKLLIMLVGDRHDEASHPLCCEPDNYYGRWTYKFEEARRKGAAGALLVHTTASAGYGWSVVRNGWSGERFIPAGEAGDPTVQGWLSEPAAVRLFQAAGQDLAALIVRAQRAAFRPIPLELRAHGQASAKVRPVQQFNVAGLLPGADPARRDQLVIVSAHWDHLGIQGPERTIYPGAVDNGSGCAGVLALAQALAAQPLARSVLFFFPAAEEQGLLGSAAYVKAPLWPLDRTRLVINLESLNVAGPTRDINLLGNLPPALRQTCARAAEQVGLTLAAARPDPTGLCFRTDHFPFAKAGIPAVSPGFSLDGGFDYLGDKAAAQARAEGFLQDRYHRPADRYEAGWDLGGMMQQLRFALTLAALAGNQP